MIWTVIKLCGIIHAIFLIIRWYLKRSWGHVDKNNEVSAKAKIIVITGGNAGIGRAAALEFVMRDAIVVLACRNLEKAQAAVDWIRRRTAKGQLVCMKLDLNSLQSVHKFVKNFKATYDRLDILINNAGVLFLPEERKKTLDNFEIHIGINHLAHFLLTNLLLEELKRAAPSRIITVSSVAHSWAKFNVNDLMGEKEKVVPKPPLVPCDQYCRSKMANALFSKELAKRLKGTGVTTYALCPGYVSTDMGWEVKGKAAFIMKPLEPLIRFFMKTSQEGAQTIIYCALNKNLALESGEMYQNCSYWDPTERVALKDGDSKKLWEESAKLVGLIK